MKLYDVIGIGFGPANLALAIALQEQNKLNSSVCFLEKQPKFLWHGDMLLDDTTMQISFLKDLVTQRNPSSHFSFINYLHHQNRLSKFTNLSTFYPSRVEFNDYLGWAASHFNEHCLYGEEVVDITAVEEHGEVSYLKVVSQDKQGEQSIRMAKNIVVSVGGTARVPAVFEELAGNPRLWHSSRYLANKHNINQGDSVAVIGSGQSAAEIFVDVQDMVEAPKVDLIMRAMTLNPADSSPFVNEIFDPSFTDMVFQQTEQEKQAYFNKFRNTNYSVVDEPLIADIYNRLYQQSLKRETRFNLLPCTDINSVTASNNSVSLSLTKKNQASPKTETRKYDHVIFATGYQYSTRPQCLTNLAPWLTSDIERNYQINTEKNFKPKIFTQGINEPTHGISDSLLSILAVRSAEIVDALFS